LKRHLILKSIFQETKLFRKVTTKATWNLVQLGGDVDPALFVFTPPPNAMRVNTLAIW
jgi:outer membrane lipoprotein-sorting protein